MAWTFTYQALPGGTPIEHTLIWWGISQPVRTHGHLKGDQLTFTVVDDTAFAAAPLLDPGPSGLEHRVWFAKDGVIKFVGLITAAPQTSDGASEQKDFTVQGIGSLLARTIFCQDRTAGLYPSTVLEPLIDPHVWLGQNAAGDYVNTGQQMVEILTYAAQQAALDGQLFTHNATGFPAVNILLDEAQGITCEQALLRMLAHSPDYVAWWDYSTTDGGLPKPTLRCQSRAAMPVRSLSRTAGHLRATPRYDILQRAVAITYEVNTQVNDQSRVILRRDFYPATLNGNPTTGREVAVMAATIPLQGSRTQRFSGAIVTEAINAAAAGAGYRVSWWLDNCPALRKEANVVEDPSTYTGASGAAASYSGGGAYTVAVEVGATYLWQKGANDTSLVNGASLLTASGEFTATDATAALAGTPGAEVTAFVGRVAVAAADVRRSGSHAYANRLLPGSGGLAPWMGFGSEEERFTTRAFVVDKTGGHYVDLAVQLTATNATTGTYATSVVLDSGEPVPAGLAQALHSSVSVLHWQGDFRLVEADATDTLALGYVLNIADADPALATARLMIWRVTVDEFMGTTTAEFGDPEHLGIGDLVDRLRALRLRNLETLPSVQRTGLADGGGAANLPTVTPRAEPTVKTHERSSVLVTSPDPAVTQKIKLELTQLVPGRTMQIETISGCVGGVTKYCDIPKTPWRDTP